MLLQYPILILYFIPVALISLCFHEFSHAYIAYRLGDPTARNMGRLTLNPLRHLDPMGTLMIIISSFYGRGFGWAKPVPINPAYFRDRKKGTILVSLAGPLSNVFLAFIFSVLMAYLEQRYNILRGRFYISSDIRAVLYNFSLLSYSINIGLAVFNILPVPPLDGSKLLLGILPARYYFKMMEYQRYISMGFLLVLFLAPQVLRTVMSPFIWILETALNFTSTLIAGILM